MSLTFAIDEVIPAADRLSTRLLGDAFGDALALGGDPELAVVDNVRTHPLLGAVHLAFSQHRPLVLSPDAVWLTIAQGVAQHIRLHAEELRPRLVRHPQRKTLELTWPEPTVPTVTSAWAEIVAAFRDAVRVEVGDGPARLFECDFSTTTDVERVASQIVLMDAYSPYFDYYLYAVCGIPEITLRGTVDDWRAIRERIDVISELELGFWARSLAPICDHFVRATAGAPDVPFWKRIFNPEDAYGGEVITGWIARLFPYLQEGGRVTRVNPLLELPIDEPRGKTRKGERWYDGVGVRSDQIPAGPSRAHVKVVEDGVVRMLALDGGVVAVSQDQAGRLEPICGWLLRSGTDIHQLIERLRSEHRVVPAPERDHSDWRKRVSGPAELVGLYDHFAEVTIFTGERSWHLRRSSEFERVQLAAPGGRSHSVLRFLDLPDGTFVAVAEDTFPTAYVRCAVDALEPLSPHPRRGKPGEYTADDIVVWPQTRTSTQARDEVPVVATSLAMLLTQVLDGGPSYDPVSIGSLVNYLPPRMR